MNRNSRLKVGSDTRFYPPVQPDSSPSQDTLSQKQLAVALADMLHRYKYD